MHAPDMFNFTEIDRVTVDLQQCNLMKFNACSLYSLRNVLECANTKHVELSPLYGKCWLENWVIL